VNPSHLFLGTAAENTADMFSKGRNADLRGEKASSAKLTEPQVRAIRAEFAAGGRYHREIAARFGVDTSTVNNIVNRRTWVHV